MVTDKNFSNLDYPPFIVFEGIDGGGKTTICKRIYDYLTKDSDCKVCQTKAPCLIKTADFEKWEKNELNAQLSVANICNFFLLDRRNHNEYIFNQRQEGYAVLSDRYDLSTYAYQANPLALDLGENEDEEALFGLIYDCHFSQSLSDGGVCLSRHSSNGRAGDFKLQFPCIIPDCTIFFDVRWDVAKKRLEDRLKKSGEERSFFEQMESLKITFRRYHQAVDFLRKKDDRNIVYIDANQDEESVFQATRKIFERFVFFEKCKKKN